MPRNSAKKPKTVDRKKAIELFIKADDYNWDLGYKRPLNILKNRHCDLGTATLIYWRTDPQYYLQYRSEKEVDQHDLDGWEFVQEVEKQILSGKFPELIRYDPTNCVHTHGLENRVRDLPAQLYNLTPGCIEVHDILSGKLGPNAINTAAGNDDDNLVDDDVRKPAAKCVAEGQKKDVSLSRV